MVTTGPGVSEQKLFENVNSSDFGHRSYIFIFLGNKECVTNTIQKPSIVLEKMTFQYFSHMNAVDSQTDLLIERSVVSLGSSFEQTW